MHWSPVKFIVCIAVVFCHLSTANAENLPDEAADELTDDESDDVVDDESDDVVDEESDDEQIDRTANRISNIFSDWDVRGNVTAEGTVFWQSSTTTADQNTNLSLSSTVEFFREIGENGTLTITPFGRVDEHDSERSHFDFREFLYSHVGESWEVRAGLGKVFFGVAESINLVDVVNQFDLVESFNTDEKLGQPMINLLLINDFADIDLFILPGFRERTYPGVDGRPRIPIPVDVDNALFESRAGNQRIDFAARASKVIGDWDLGVNLFNGVDREPTLQFDPALNVLVPFYPTISQFGFDAQATLESWLLKAEVVHRWSNSFANHLAFVSGFEYSFFDIKGSGLDLGIVSEYLFDGRGQDAPTIAQNDVLFGLRFALNDAASTDALLGVIVDLEGDGTIVTLEANRRFGSNFKGTVNYTAWSVSEPSSPLAAFDTEDNIRFEFGYFF